MGSNIQWGGLLVILHAAYSLVHYNSYVKATTGKPVPVGSVPQDVVLECAFAVALVAVGILLGGDFKNVMTKVSARVCECFELRIYACMHTSLSCAYKRNTASVGRVSFSLLCKCLSVRFPFSFVCFPLPSVPLYSFSKRDRAPSFYARLIWQISRQTCK